jgi:ABC-2 type transport system permease protein
MTALRALLRKELSVLFASPIAYLVMASVALMTAIVFFEHLRLYNQILFLFASTTMGGFETDTIPDHVNLRDTVFNPVMEQLSLMLVIPIPLVTMRVFAEERARGTDELLLTSGLHPLTIITAKFAATFAFVVLAMAASFVYPVTAIVQGGLGLQHLAAVFLGLSLLALAFASIGLACSAFTGSQIIAAASAAALCFLLYDFGWAGAFVGERGGAILEAISLHPRFGRFAEGIVAFEDLVYFAGLTAVTAAAANLAFALRRSGG